MTAGAEVAAVAGGDAAGGRNPWGANAEIPERAKGGAGEAALALWSLSAK